MNSPWIVSYICSNIIKIRKISTVTNKIKFLKLLFEDAEQLLILKLRHQFAWLNLVNIQHKIIITDIIVRLLVLLSKISINRFFLQSDYRKRCEAVGERRSRRSRTGEFLPVDWGFLTFRVWFYLKEKCHEIVNNCFFI